MNTVNVSKINSLYTRYSDVDQFHSGESVRAITEINERERERKEEKARRERASLWTAGSLIRESSRVESRFAIGHRATWDVGCFISEDAAVVVVKYFVRPAGKGGAEINANAFHGCIRAGSLYLVGVTSGKIHVTSFSVLIQEEDIRNVHCTCSTLRDVQ